jgi:hypothetical protein
MRSQVRLGKGSQQILKSITERLIRSVQNPYEGMQFVPPTNDIPTAGRCLSIGTLSLGLAMCSPVGSDPLPPLPVPCTEGYLTQFFPHFFNHKE